jgi:hypothetical protein
MRELFYICYEKLRRNIARIIRIIPDVVTTRMFYEYLSLLDYIKNIEDRSFMFLPFREALSKLFTIVLKILVKCSPLYLKSSYYYKYLSRVVDLTEPIYPFSLDFVVELTCELNDELNNRITILIRESVIAEPINFGEVVGNVSLNNIGKIPQAGEYTGEKIVGRNVDPINYNRPIANAVLVESQSRVSAQSRRPPRLPPRRTRTRSTRLGNNISLNEPDNTTNRRVGSAQNRRPARRPPRRTRITQRIQSRSTHGNISLNAPNVATQGNNTSLNQPQENISLNAPNVATQRSIHGNNTSLNQPQGIRI